MTRVRTIDIGDFTTIAEYEKEISIISFGPEAITDLAFHMKKLEKSFKKERDGMLVLDNSGEICGWLWMAVKSNSLTDDRYVNFKSFYIKEDYRKGEYANQLLDAGMSFCKKAEVKNITGKVHVKNLAMRALYKNYGFEPTHITMEYNFRKVQD